MQHDGFTNKYTLSVNGRIFTVKPSSSIEPPILSPPVLLLEWSLFESVMHEIGFVVLLVSASV